MALSYSITAAVKKKKKCHRLGACKKQASISPALEAGPEARAECRQRQDR